MIVTDPGMQFLAHASAIGKIQLTQYSFHELQELYSEKELEQKSPYTIKNIDELWRQLESAKQTGYICEEQESSLGFYCFAAPVYNYENNLPHWISLTKARSLFSFL
ncbi:IclR family transcriptional regulator domain-containing protein [Neobacillus ginsengisoli]|uniref:DNA-binding IclR family transcriptional regulator n=1 Tax=Neobacillus ginsengisoli TaxID=904295 RepID=A0ABT9XUV4_9BACI|nr:IclR family transcriptional regulator C-terminal domain-containing protein [Neobacillus ginsengisoli]MDQ0199354.1 DNA-binding IclR family transcriptional regulator [Neobacillus ginsengisoli]